METQRTGNAFEAAEGGLDFRRHLLAIRRRKWLVLGAVGAALFAAALLTTLQPRVYAARSAVVLDLVAPRVLEGQVQDVIDDDRANYWTNKEFTGTQYRIIQSRAVASRVVEKLGLQQDAAFLGLARIRDEAERAQKMARLDAVEVLQRKLSVIPEKDTRVVYIEVRDGDPGRAAQLANEVTAAYLAESEALKARMTQSASSWLEERLRELEQTSKTSELAVYDFKKQADVLSTSLDNRLSIVSERLGAYSAELTRVRTNIAGLKARLQAMEQLRSQSMDDPRWAEPLAEANGPPLLNELRSGLLKARADCVLQAERNSPQHPEVVACQQQVRVLEQDLRRELDNLVKAARVQLAEASAHERNLGALLEAAKLEAFDVNKKQIEFARLQRDATNNQRLYDVVLSRLKDIELSGMLRTSNVRVLDPARPDPEPVSPRVPRNLAAGLLAGLMLGVGLALLLERLDSTLRTEADVQEQLQVPFLGLLPRLPVEADAPLSARDLYVLREPASSAAECCRAIRTQLLFATPDAPVHTLVVTSCAPGEGKSTLAISLGVALAQSGSRTLLVDTDMRRPRLHEAFGMPNDVGVSTLVLQQGTLEQAIRSTEVPGLSVLPCGPLPPHPAELLHTRAFQELLAQLEGRFDRILLDSPPVNTVADAAVLAAQSDAVLLVLQARSTRSDAARRALRTLHEVNASVLGAVLNAVDPKDARESYGAYGGYGQDTGEDTRAGKARG